MKLLLATSNRGKVQEISQALNALHFDILTPLDFPTIDGVPEESAETFAENATTKARFYAERTGLPTLADDSGIIVEPLQDELGIHTRRWGAGPHASDEEWIAYFLKRMEREQNRRAHFVCSLAYIDADGSDHLFEGHCNGTITRTLEADFLPGLPISACFKPDGFDRVYSALTVEEKNRISHRGLALQQFINYIQNIN